MTLFQTCEEPHALSEPHNKLSIGSAFHSIKSVTSYLMLINWVKKFSFLLKKNISLTLSCIYKICFEISLGGLSFFILKCWFSTSVALEKL